VIRVRPFLESEFSGGKRGKQRSAQFTTDPTEITLLKPDMEKREFNFDSVLDPNASQETSYE